ncbi:MAG: hypothetical protein ACXVBK_16335 [Flavisolibacter sp.]
MRILLLLLFTTICTRLNSQTIYTRPTREFKSQKYLSLNPFGLAEGNMAIGAGFGNRLTSRSEYFSELSYLSKSALYDYVHSLQGFRLIGQYRFHFLVHEASHPGEERKRDNTQFFVGLEFRLKQYNFSNNASFIRVSTHDTLSNYEYDAKATCLAGAIIFGTCFDLSANGKWQFEFTAGIGGKSKIVHFKNLPQGFELFVIPPREWGYVPPIAESKNTVYMPSAIRIRYRIR